MKNIKLLITTFFALSYSFAQNFVECVFNAIPTLQEKTQTCGRDSSTYRQTYWTPSYWSAKSNTHLKTILVNIVVCRKVHGTGS